MVKKKKEKPIDFSEDSGAGFEGVTQEDLGIPFLTVLQKLSPELDEDSPKYNKDLEAGAIINSVTGIAYGGRGEPVEFIPCVYQKMYVEWQPREKGGGFIRSHQDIAILSGTQRNELGKDVLDSGNIIVTTAYIYGFVIDDENELIRCVISLTSTQLKKARQWLGVMMSIKLDGPDGKFTPPMYSHKYNLSTVPEENEKGKWFGWKIENAGLIDNQKFVTTSREAHRQIVSGKAGLLSAGQTQDEEHDRF